MDRVCILFSQKICSASYANHIDDTQAPRTSKGVLRSGRSFGKDSPMVHWQSIIESLNTLLCTLKENFVRSFVTILLTSEYYAITSLLALSIHFF
jgi:hypothetical protein